MMIMQCIVRFPYHFLIDSIPSSCFTNGKTVICFISLRMSNLVLYRRHLYGKGKKIIQFSTALILAQTMQIFGKQNQ